MKKKTSPSRPAISPGWIRKTSSSGKTYRACTISLDLLPLLLETEDLETIGASYYSPEGGLVLGVRKREKPEDTAPLPHRP